MIIKIKLERHLLKWLNSEFYYKNGKVFTKDRELIYERNLLITTVLYMYKRGISFNRISPESLIEKWIITNKIR